MGTTQGSCRKARWGGRGGGPGLQGTNFPVGVLGDMCLSPGSGRRHNLPRPELQAGAGRLELPSQTNMKRASGTLKGMETARTNAEPVPAVVGITSRSDPKAVPDKFPLTARLSA